MARISYCQEYHLPRHFSRQPMLPQRWGSATAGYGRRPDGGYIPRHHPRHSRTLPTQAADPQGLILAIFRMRYPASQIQSCWPEMTARKRLSLALSHRPVRVQEQREEHKEWAQGTVDTDARIFLRSKFTPLIVRHHDRSIAVGAVRVAWPPFLQIMNLFNQFSCFSLPPLTMVTFVQACFP